MTSLSFLIPTYNFVCIPLAAELSRQISLCGIEAEVIVMDDGSTDEDSVNKNKEINNLPHCRYIVNGHNIGRAAIRNLLAASAQHEHIVFLDSDVFPSNDQFVSQYAEAATMADVVCGGICYRRDAESKVCRLRYVVGNAAESFTAEQRSANPYGKFSSANFMTTRTILKSFPFDETLTRYGYEDVLFGKQLEDYHISIAHISNAIFHDDNDTSEQYLTKARTATENLLLIADKIGNRSNVINAYKKVRRFHLDGLMSIFYTTARKLIERNLLGNNPSHLLFNIYKLTYYCHLCRLQNNQMN